MARKFFIDNNFENNLIEISGDEFNHIVNVSRKIVGDEIIVINGKGLDYNCKIVEINKKCLKLKVLSSIICDAETKSDVTVYQALVKSDKLELITQKLTELGIKRFVPFVSSFCQVKANSTRVDRLDKISIEALKQCGRSKSVIIDKVKSFNEVIDELNQYDLVIFAYEKSKNSLKDVNFINSKKVAIIIGSEGGFSEEENKIIISLKNVKSVSLGKRILRAETASISLTSVVMFKLGEWENI